MKYIRLLGLLGLLIGLMAVAVDCTSASKALKTEADFTGFISAEVANLLPCRHGCLNALETLFHDLNIGVKIGMEAAMPREGYCQFAASKV